MLKNIHLLGPHHSRLLANDFRTFSWPSYIRGEKVNLDTLWLISLFACLCPFRPSNIRPHSVAKCRKESEFRWLCGPPNGNSRIAVVENERHLVYLMSCSNNATNSRPIRISSAYLWCGIYKRLKRTPCTTDIHIWTKWTFPRRLAWWAALMR